MLTVIRQALAIASDIIIVGEAASGQELLLVLEQVPCDILMMDMTMPGMNGLELIKRVKQSGLVPAILVMSMHNQSQFASRALAAGAVGYITKDNDPETLVGAIRTVAGGGQYVEPVLPDAGLSSAFSNNNTN